MVIYKILNIANGKAYIGQTVQSVQDRLRHHLSGQSGCKAIKSAINKYGIENFEITELTKAENLDQLNELEIKFINELNTLAPNGYNLKSGGNRPKYSEESRKRMSEANRGRKLTDQQKLNASKRFSGSGNPNYGKKFSEEHKQKLKDAKKGKYIGEKHPFFGKTHSEESKLKISKSSLGRSPWNKNKKTHPDLIKQKSESQKCLYKITSKDGNVIFCKGATETSVFTGIKKGSILGRMSSHNGKFDFGPYLIERTK